MKTRIRGLQSICHQLQNRFRSVVRTTSTWWADSGALISNSRFNLSRLFAKFVSRIVVPTWHFQITRQSSFGHTKLWFSETCVSLSEILIKITLLLLSLYMPSVYIRRRTARKCLRWTIRLCIQMITISKTYEWKIFYGFESICNYLFIIVIPQNQQSAGTKSY